MFLCSGSGSAPTRKATEDIKSIANHFCVEEGPMEKPPASSNPDIGNWEKHTKGIGLKLLQKFGFNGRLGAKENGVSRAIEVVVRPNNVGLGFGDIKEAASLKVNKKIEAEWRGVDFVDTEEEEKKLKKSSVERLAAAKGWKKNKTEKVPGRANLSAEDFINKYMNEDAVQKPQQVIIDMRYKDTRVVTDMADISNDAFIDEQALASLKPKLGEELLYNINLISNTEEMGVTRDSKQLAREVLKIRTLKEDKARIETASKMEAVRLARLQKILLILSRIDEKLAAAKNGSDKDELSPQQEISLSAVCGLIRTLHQNFAEEFQIFGLINLLPNLISRVVVVDAWDPFADHAYLCDIYDSLTPLVEYFERADEVQLARQTNKALYDIIELRFLPVVRRAVASQWDTVNHPEQCVKLMQSLRLVLPAATFEQTIDMFLLPKLTSTVASWRPSTSAGTGIHTWLHPWLPLLTTKLSALYPDIRRKFGTLLSSFDYHESQQVVNMLLPWVNVFDNTSFENLLVRSAMPRIVSALREELRINPAQQDIVPVQCALAWSALVPALPVLHLACLWAGEFFPRWLRVLFTWLTPHSAGDGANSDHSPDYEEISTWYSGWKSLFPESLLAEEMVMDCFNLALDMMQTSMMAEGEPQPAVGADGRVPKEHCMYAFQTALERLESANYYTLIEARKSVQRAQRRLEALSAEENLQYSNSLKQATTAGLSSSHQSVTFKEVVETYAARNNVEFLPKIGRFYEGKQMWQFGRSLCFLDQNVVFVSTVDKAGKRPAGDSTSSGNNGSSGAASASRQELYGWAPIALEDLLNMSK